MGLLDERDAEFLGGWLRALYQEQRRLTDEHRGLRLAVTWCLVCIIVLLAVIAFLVYALAYVEGHKLL
jgi:hypothetical protein